jgi:hypothetical protein
MRLRDLDNLGQTALGNLAAPDSILQKPDQPKLEFPKVHDHGEPLFVPQIEEY